MQVISRKAAKAAGLKHYYTGKACKRGHLDRRMVCSFACMECARQNTMRVYRSLDTAQRREIRVKQKPNLTRWIESNREHWLASQKTRNARHKLERPDYFKQHYAANKERRKQESQAWYLDNAEYAGQRQKAYNDAHPDEVRARGRKSANTRRARTNLVFVEVIDPRVVFERDKGVCGICLTAVDPASNWEIDHVIPISKGGLHSYANVQLSHRKCNRSKCNRLPDDRGLPVRDRDYQPEGTRGAARPRL